MSLRFTPTSQVLLVLAFEECTDSSTSLLVVPLLLTYHHHPHLALFSGEICHVSNNVATVDFPPPRKPIAFQKGLQSTQNTNSYYTYFSYHHPTIPLYNLSSVFIPKTMGEILS